MPLTTVDEWGNYTAAPAPANAAALLAAASAKITRYCGWGIARETVTGQVLDSDGGWLLRLPTLYLVSVTSVQVDGTAVSDFTVSRRGMLDRRPGGWPEGFGRVTASYVHGYDPVPADLKALSVAVALRGRDTATGRTGLTVGAISETFDSAAAAVDLSDLDRLSLDAYRLEPA